MKDLFPGYFRPSEEEFRQLWKDASFAFDASALLDVYRSTSETRNVFLGIVEKLREQVFLPFQAAYEYLENRQEVISGRVEGCDNLKAELEKVRALIERISRHQALPNEEEIVAGMNTASDDIVKLLDDAVKKVPDLDDSDPLMDRLAKLFDGKTGRPFDESRLQQVYEESKERFRRRVPPGYKDQQKEEPERYGDVVLWFQIIEHAKATKKPAIFITSDSKDDWWLMRKGKTLGPRPELGQEMLRIAGVGFYMYTPQKFVEYAQGYLKTDEDAAKKAASELERIEKREPFMIADMLVENWRDVWSHGLAERHRVGKAAFLSGLTNSVSGLASLGSVLGVRPQNEHRRLLGLDDKVFPIDGIRWRAAVVNEPDPVGGDQVCYDIEFMGDTGTSCRLRRLRLWLSDAGLRHDPEAKYKNAILIRISEWLRTGEGSEEIQLFT